MEDFPAHHVWKNQRVAVWPSRNPRCPHRLAALVTRNWGEVCCRWEGYTTVRLLGSPIPQGRSCNGQVPYIVTRESAHREKERERERVHAQLWQDCSQPVGNWTSHMIELLRFWSFLFIQFFLRGKSSPFLFVRHVSIFLLKCQSPKNQSMEVLGSFKSSFSAMASHFHMVPCYWRSVRQPQPPICIYLHPFAHFWEDISTSHLHIPKQRVHTKGFLGLARFYGWAGYRLELNRLD